MPKYIYKCESCNVEYSEIRDITQPQIFTKCRCGQEFVEITNNL